MTPLGWLMMIASCSSVIALTAFCLYRVLTLPPVEVGKIHSRLEMETQDRPEDH
jgi:hypothetical protein